ncbi:MAG: RNA polymerase sigma factor [Acidobacteria bacterium]|nr:RNA polymerase sigma factor [Acidobacteriota bacterium]
MLKRDEGFVEPDDAELVRLAQQGDRDAAERLVEITSELVYASLFRLCGGDADLAADLTQDTYQRAWQSLHGFRGESKVGTWLYRIAYTTFLNHVRRPRIVESLDEERASAISDPGPGTDGRAFANIEGEKLRLAVLALPEKLQYLVTAHYWGEVPIADIAHEEGITTVAVRKRLAKALRMIQDVIEEST